MVPNYILELFDTQKTCYNLRGNDLPRTFGWSFFIHCMHFSKGNKRNATMSKLCS